MKRGLIVSKAVLALTLTVHPPLIAQDDLPQPMIGSKAELLRSLKSGGLSDDPTTDAYHMLIALGGSKLVPMLIEIVADSAEGPLRWPAMDVLHYLRPRAAVPLLMKLAEDREKNSLGWNASVALMSFTYPEVCDYWRRTTRSTRGTITWRHSVRALMFCAAVDNEQDLKESLQLIREINRFTAHDDLKSVTEKADSIISKRLRGLPIEATGLEWPGTPAVDGGRFVPPPPTRPPVRSSGGSRRYA